MIAGTCKTEVMDIFHRLGLSCHPSTVRRQLQAAADYFHKDIMRWKTENETNMKAVKLLQKVLQHQVQSQAEDTMDVCSVDFSTHTLSGYKYYELDTYAKCSSLLPKESNLMDDDILEAILEGHW